MPDPDVPTGALVLVERLAGAIRDALGEEIDAYPGSRSPEGADPLNRAFAAVVRSILDPVTTDAPALPAAVSLTLRLATERRLAAEGWSHAQVRALIEEEPGSPDDWLVFLLLSARAQIEPLFDTDGGDPIVPAARDDP